MNQSGRNSANVTSNSSNTSTQLHLVRNHAMVAAAKTMEAAVAPTTTMSSSNQPSTSMSKSMGLKMNMNGSTAVRMAYVVPWIPVANGLSPEMAAAANVANPTGGVMSAMIP